MPRIVHVALARVYRSLSRYGNTPFVVPEGSPKILSVGSKVLEVHLGEVPPWQRRAEARISIIGEAMLHAMFLNDPIARDQLDTRLSNAKDHVFVEEKHQWLVALVLRWRT